MLKLIFTVWVVLWVFFLVREDKDGQYGSLAYLYTHGYNDKVRYIMGGRLYDFLVFCERYMPKGTTFDLSGFEPFSIDEVRARYFLWPLRSVGNNPDFVIVYGETTGSPAGYKEYKRYGKTGRLLIREGIDG
ncbi:MAG: hypothetical protein U9R44_02930 [Candidatus Omnitrophota bacterium]|nr:hypothetical protein [Candidatus Omnitrophota bacterium]